MDLDPSLIPSFKKSQYLKSLSEDDFRDTLVRPLFLRKGLRFGPDLCGPSEAGKDCIFTTTDPLGVEIIYFIQTKKGSLNLSRKHEDNVQEAIVQLRTGFSSTIINTSTKQRYKANFGILCVSGVIGASAQQHIIDEVKEQNLRFMDSDTLIPEIDSLYPEFWHSIEPEHLPYLKKLHEGLLSSSELITINNTFAKAEATSIVSDSGFATLRLSRNYLKPKKQPGGQIAPEAVFEDISANSLLEQNSDHILILGDAGSGKSTILRRLAVISIQQSIASGSNIALPVLIRSVEIEKSTSNLAELAMASSQKFTLSSNSAFGVQELQGGKVILLIDALDEVANDENKVEVLRKIRDFNTNYPKCKTVITSREHSIIVKSEFIQSYRFYRVLPLGWKEAESIVNSLDRKKNVSQDHAKEILRQLENVHGIELNPLLVTVFVATSDGDKKDIPANITELFSKFCEMMLGRWDSDKGLSQQFESKLKDLLLQKLAHSMHSKRVIAIPQQECHEFLEAELIDLGKNKLKTDVLINEMLVRSGLFRVVDGNYEFVHLMLQEYFAGRHISSVAEVLAHCADEWWRRPIIFYFGANPEDGDSLFSVACDYKGVNKDDEFNAAITLGLSLQACYFVKLQVKMDIFKSLVDTLARGGDNFFRIVDEDSKLPITHFLYGYLLGRDAVAADILEHVNDCDDLINPAIPTKERHFHRFWIIAGMIEAGLLEKADLEVRKFIKTNSDARLFLGLALGGLLIYKMKVATSDKKKLAKHIHETLTPHITHLQHQLALELKSQLLELRRGKIVEIETSGD